MGGFPAQKDDAAGTVRRVVFGDQVIEVVRPEKDQFCEAADMARTGQTPEQIVDRSDDLHLHFR